MQCEDQIHKIIRLDTAYTFLDTLYNESDEEEEYKKYLRDQYREAKAEVRESSANVIANRKAKLVDIIFPKLVAASGAAVGGALSNQVAKLALRKTAARIAFLQMKGTLISPKEKLELIKLMKKYKLVRYASIGAGAVAGGTLAYKAVIPPMIKKNRKELYRTEF